jgi:pyruvate dehydrogenase E2 component (dihydrolipoamide acetyltransferase)
MPREIRLQKMSLTMEQGIIVGWLKREGESVKKGEPLVQVETDKAVQEMEAPANGVLARILTPAGAQVPVEAVIALLE